MLIRIFSPTECGLIRDADLKKCGLNQMTTVFLSVVSHLFVVPILVFWVGLEKKLNNQTWM